MSSKIAARAFAAVAVIILLSGIAAAHEDRFPTVVIDAPRTVVTTAAILVAAEDEDFQAGVSYIELYEDDRLIERKECSLRLHCEFEKTFEHSEESTHTYRGLASDATGHKTYASAAVRFEGSDRPPVISTVSKASVDEGSQLAIDVRGSDPNGDPVTLTVRGMPVGSRFENGQFVWTPTFSQSGIYILTFEANTATKKATKTVRIDVRDRNREFVVRDSTPSHKDIVSIDEGDSRRFFVNAFDPDGDTLSFRWVLDGRVVSYSPTYIYRPSFSDAGTHELAVTIKEGSFFLERAEALTAGRRWTIEVRDVDRQPTLNEQRKFIVEEGHRVWFLMKADDPDKDVLTIEASNLPAGAEFNPQTGVFRWDTAVGDHGKYQPNFRVTDSKGLTAAKGVLIEVRRKPLAKIVHEDLHRVGKVQTFAEENEDRDKRFAWDGYGLIG